MRYFLTLWMLAVGLVPSVSAAADDTYQGAPDIPVISTLEKVSEDYSGGTAVFKLTWNAPDSYGATISGYDLYVRQIEQEPDSEEGVFWHFDFASNPWTKVKSISASSTSTSVTMDYYWQDFEFTLVAKNKYGSSHEPLAKWQGVAVGDMSACALNSFGNVYCWGDSQGYGELFTSELGFTHPRLAMLPGKASSIVAGWNHFCALVTGVPYCWGDNYFGQIQPEGPAEVLVPTRVELPSAIQQLSLGHDHSCALLVDATVYCWGDNSAGQLGQDGAPAGPVKLEISDAAKVATGEANTCVLTNSGDVRCAGYIPDFLISLDQEIGFGKATDVAAGQHVVCAITDPGVKCLGFSGNGEAGSSYEYATTPRLVPGTKDLLESIYTKTYGVCGLSRDKAVWCWGTGIAGAQYWDADPAIWPYTAEHHTGLLRPVELANRAPAEMYSPDMGDEPIGYLPYATRPYTDAYFNQQPIMRDPSTLSMGTAANCGIDTFGDLWCRRNMTQGDEIYSWINWEIERNLPAGSFTYSYDWDPYVISTELRQVQLLEPVARFTFALLDNKAVVGGKPKILGLNQAGQTLRAQLPASVGKASHIEYLWFRGMGEFTPGNLHKFELIGQSNSASYQLRPEDAGMSIGLRIKAISTGKIISLSPADALAFGEGAEVANPFGWTKRLSDTQAKLYAKDIIGAGKVVFKLNGKEIAWVSAQDESDPKLRLAGGSNYLVRTVNLAPGKNVLEVYINGERVRRTVYSR